MRASIDELMLALNDHRTKTGDRLEDGTFLGVLQKTSHRFLLETCYDESRPTLDMIKALAAIGDAFLNTTRKARVSDAIRLLSKLREAAMTKDGRSKNLQLSLDNWLKEEDDESLSTR